MPISYYNPKQEIRLSAYADTIVLEPDGREQRLRAIRFGGYPEMVRAMADAIYAGATLETEFAGETAMLTCEPKKYECHLSHDGIYAEATILSLDDADTAAKKDEDAQADGQTNVELPPRKCVLFCPAGDRQALFEALDRKTAVPLIPEFQDYVLDELQRRRLLKPLRVISIRERLEAWLLLCKKDDANIVKVLEDGLKSGAIRIPGTVQNLNGFDSVHSVTSYLSAFGVTVAERIRNQFQPLFDPAAEQLSPEILRINDYIRARAGYSLYPAQLAVAESVKRKLSEGKSAFIVAECGSGKTKIGATALAAYQAQKRKKTFNIILCPSHVAKKWVREIAETLPDTAGVIVRSITELDSLYAQYRQGDKSIYAVISKEKARDGYMRRPAVLFDARKGAFRCPVCGSVIELPSSDDTYDWVTAKPEAFRMENRRNHQCMNCGEPLWTAVNPSVPSPWVKIPEYGWVHRKLAVHAMQKTKNPAALDALQALQENPDGYFPTRGACRRYPLSSYIKKRYRGRLDGLIVDELHEYNNDSGQGDAMSQLATRDHNLFGIKWASSFASCPEVAGKASWATHEEVDGQVVTVMADFTVFQSDAGCIRFRSRVLLQNSRYADNALIKEAIADRDSDKMAEGLKDAGYATSSEYVESLKSVMRTYNLYRFDGMGVDDFEKGAAGGDAIVQAAYSQLGVPYVWGGSTPGVGLDCSGLTQYCYRQAGISISHYTEDQLKELTVVPLSQARPGDILYKYGHVAIYVGGDEYIHEPRTGDVCRKATGISFFTCALRYTG